MIYNFRNGKVVFQKEGVVGKLINKSNNCEFVEINIDEKQIVESHVLNVFVSFYVIQGIGELMVDKNKYMLTKGDLISVDSGVSRSWVNKGSQELRLLVIKEM